MSSEEKKSIFKIRKATYDDVSALAILHVKTFNETHGINPNGPTYELRLLQWSQAFKDMEATWFCFVIESKSGGLIGFAKGQPYNHIEFSEYSGELNKIYLLRKYQKQGLGRKLMSEVVDEFLRQGITSMLLFGDANNPSNRFYERMGGEKLFAKNGEFHGGYGWKDLQKFQFIRSSSRDSNSYEYFEQQ